MSPNIFWLDDDMQEQGAYPEDLLAASNVDSLKPVRVHCGRFEILDDRWYALDGSGRLLGPFDGREECEEAIRAARQDARIGGDEAGR